MPTVPGGSRRARTLSGPQILDTITAESAAVSCAETTGHPAAPRAGGRRDLRACVVQLAFPEQAIRRADGPTGHRLGRLLTRLT